MNNKRKYIGISNRIPFVVLEYAIADYLKTGVVNSQDYLSYIKEYTKGDNRAKKTLNHVNSILKKNRDLLKLLSKELKNDFTILSINDRRALILCLFSLTFPIAYDILNSFAVGFKVQEHISKRVIIEKIGSIYGSNRSMYIGLDESMPTIIDSMTLERVKTGIFKKGISLQISNSLIAEIIIFTDLKLSASKTILKDDLEHKPWYMFFDISIIQPDKLKSIICFKDSAVGKGYLTIR